MQNSIAARAALLRVTPLSVYSPASRLEEMAADYAARTGIDRRQLRGSKKLLPEELFAPLRESMKAMVAYLDQSTSLWEDGGWRITRADRVIEVETEVSMIAREFHRRRDAILAGWQSVEDEMRWRLGAAFDAGRFPSVDKVREHLTISSAWKPVPSGSDWRIDLPQEIIARTEADVRASLAAQQDRVRSRVIAAITGLRDKVAGWQDGKSRLHQSTLDEVANLATVIPGLLIEEDAELLDVCNAASRAMRGVDRDILRDSTAAREEAAAAANALLAQMGISLAI